MSRRAFWVIGGMICFGLFKGLAAEEPPLPQPIGELNDYAGILGQESRQQLQRSIDELKTQGVKVFLLITLLDPFSDPAQLAERIWQAWKLAPERTILIVFVREADQWALWWKLTPDLASQLDYSSTGEYRSSLERLLKERRVGQAVVHSIESLRGWFAPPKASEELPPRAGPSAGSPLFWYLLAGAGGVGMIAGLIWFALVWLCPECGGRLSRRSAWAFGPGRWARSRRRERVYYCARCGYLRIRRGER